MKDAFQEGIDRRQDMFSMGQWDDSAPECIACGGRRHSVIREGFDDRYGQPDLFAVSQCRDCGQIVTVPRLSDAALPALYATYYPRKQVAIKDIVRESRAAGSTLRRILRWIHGTNNQGQYLARPGQRVLDIGCGSCLSLLEAKSLGAEPYGVEADPNVEWIARELGLRVHIGSLLDDPFPGVFFDLVVLNQVIEHVPDPAALLNRLRTILAPGGRIFLSFPNTRSLWCRWFGPCWINWHIPYHLHHFHIDSFSKFATRCGFRIERSRTLTPNLWTSLQFRAVKYVPVRGRACPIWQADLSVKVSRGFRARVNRFLRSFVRLPVLVLILGVNRIADALNLGDSIVVILRPRERM